MKRYVIEYAERTRREYITDADGKPEAMERFLTWYNNGHDGFQIEVIGPLDIEVHDVEEERSASQ